MERAAHLPKSEALVKYNDVNMVEMDLPSERQATNIPARVDTRFLMRQVSEGKSASPDHMLDEFHKIAPVETLV